MACFWNSDVELTIPIDPITVAMENVRVNLGRNEILMGVAGKGFAAFPHHSYAISAERNKTP